MKDELPEPCGCVADYSESDSTGRITYFVDRAQCKYPAKESANAQLQQKRCDFDGHGHADFLEQIASLEAQLKAKDETIAGWISAWNEVAASLRIDEYIPHVKRVTVRIVDLRTSLVELETTIAALKDSQLRIKEHCEFIMIKPCDFDDSYARKQETAKAILNMLPKLLSTNDVSQ